MDKEADHRDRGACGDPMYIGSQNSSYIWEEQGTKLHAKPSASASCPSTASQSTHMVDSNACPTTDKADSLLCSTFMWLSLFWESLSQGNSGKEILYPEFVSDRGGKEKLSVPATAQIKTLLRLLKHQQMGQLLLSSQPVSRPRLSIDFVS